ncbi:MAG: glycosyl hydrolase [Bacteroidota bacterium]|nr:glycosyl hydrolase [Bacteroidota bacterium]
MHLCLAQQSSQTSSSSSAANTVLAKISYDGLHVRSIGPALFSGRIVSIAVHPTNKSIWYIAAASGGVWKTTNSGISWQAIFEKEASYSIGCVAIDPQNPHTVWVGTGENNSQRSVGYGDGVYRSDDGGASWKNMGLKTSEHIARILIDPRNSNVVYVAAQGPLWSSGGERGLYKTTDGGKTWKLSLGISENTGVSDVVFDPRNPDILYASAYQRRRHTWTLINGGPECAVYKSTDAGATWTKIEKGLPSGTMGRIGLAISPVNPDILYATVEAAHKQGGIFRSTNRGATWEKRNSFDMTAMYYGTIYTDPHNADRIYVMNVHIMASDDGGTTLKPLGSAAKHVDNHAMWIDPGNPDHYLVGCDGGLYESFDRGEHWRHTTNLPITQFYRVSVDNSTPFYYVYGGTQDNFSVGGPSRTISASGPNNYDWFVTQGGDGFKSQIDPENPNIVYAQYQYGGIARYDRKSGESLGIKPIEGKDEEPLRWNWDAPLIISPHNPARLYFGANKLFRSDDRGQSWRAVSPDLSRRIDRNTLPVMGKIQPADAVAKHASTAFYGNISALAESPKKEGLIVVGTDDGLVQITDDGGKTWRAIQPVGGTPERAYVSVVLCSQHDANVLYVAYDNHKNGDYKPYLFKSTDAGKTWVALRNNLPSNGMVLSIAEDHATPNLLFVGTEFGVFVSINGGNSWKQLQGNMPTIPVRDIAVQKRENDLVLATFGRGIYILDDYTPLRALAQGTVDLSNKEVFIFPIKDALCYVESTPFGDRGKGFLGETFYIGENAPFGAIFTIYLRDVLKTKRQIRHEAEKAGSTKYPSPEELRAEEEEDPPAYYATITDAEGNTIRQLSVRNTAGLQRVVWNLRYAYQAPIAQHKSNDAEYGGPRVLPGEYKVFLSKRVNGIATRISEPVSFMVVPLHNTTLPAADRRALVEFQRSVAHLQRAVLAAVELATSTKARLQSMKNALDETMASNAPQLRSAVVQLEQRMNAILRVLRGDATLTARNEPVPPSIQDRINTIVQEQYASTSTPPQTHIDSYAIASQSLEQELAQLKSIVDREIPTIEQAMEAAAAPYTPGRFPEWKHKK